MALVLVADDDDVLRAVVRLSLELEGHIVEEAADGQLAIDALRRARPDVLVLDMMMPRKNGADVLRHLQAQQTPSRPCVVAYSASSGHLELAETLGADATVLKSGELETLLAAVSRCAPGADSLDARHRR